MTNNISNSGKSPTFFEPSPLKLVFFTAVTMLVCILASGMFIYIFVEAQAKQYTDKQVTMVKDQAKITLQPMILSKDTLSMNMYLKTLNQAEFINGITLLNGKQQLIARAGNSQGEKESIQLFSQQLAVGELSIFINRGSSSQFFNKLLWVYSALALFTSLFTLLVIGVLAKKVLRDFSNQYKPLLEHRFSMELAKAANPIEPVDSPAPSSPLKPELVIEKQVIQDNVASLAIVDLDTNKIEKEQPLSEIEENISQDPLNQVIEVAENDSEPTSNQSTKQLLENDELVSLLKPDSEKRMPHFKPFSEEQDTNLLDNPANHEIELTEVIQVSPAEAPPVEQTPTPVKSNPLLRTPVKEEQLDLYSLEHQSELNLKAINAAYVLFIDCSSGRAPIEDQEEHNKLLTQYRKLVNLVINIYGGQLELSANGDIRVLFNDRDEDDNHGIQSLCAAKLFNQLYKYYNHRQITRMQPTLNIQTSLVRGHCDKIEILREESHFLTCTTVSNELISHTPLSEVEALKESLLEGAKTERQDEDKILILKLNPTYQELLEKQARHLAKSF